MAASDYLTADEKKTLLEGLRQGYARDIVRLCTELGLDYETFDHSTYTAPTPVTAHQQTLLATASTALVLVEEKLQAFS